MHAFTRVVESVLSVTGNLRRLIVRKKPTDNRPPFAW